ncbi:MAG TPA: MarR family transcriptional regulator [Bacteroidales bacterium]|jgi:DNA-binding MarR family transcriptional regulator|nr:MarR family transcriptional regulator [Bacteroidales bacterium]MDI9574116.1 MarR family transcriptional regulator [Bacteroidota bacterium]OQC61484.1 MAG: transcriptional regulator SlyA [Bacteroidetes bacterium ADurb.Bin012]NMD16447.1 MarR family transcriptional regulator [Bacteroidales bacterium]HNQ59088.1 MarR family transcriptional regulator [Bacteroidales bacterium]
MEEFIEIISQLSHLIGEAEEKAREDYHKLHLTITQMHYLEMINFMHNPNITELAAQLNLSKPSVKAVVDKLIEKSCIYKVRSDADRRSTHLHLTEKGKLIQQMHDKAHRNIAELFEHKLTEEEIGKLEELLTKVLRE